MRKNILTIGIIVLLLVVLLFYSLGNEGLGFVERLSSGADKVVHLITTPGDTDGTDDTDDTDDTEEEDDGDGTGTWHTIVYQDSGICAGGDSVTSITPLTGIPVFTSGSSDIIITVYTVWTDPLGCSPCDPGVIWCVHDSDGTQVYHASEPNPKATTATITGHWDGSNPWSAFIGNNCACAIDGAFKITVKWYG